MLSQPRLIASEDLIDDVSDEALRRMQFYVCEDPSTCLVSSGTSFLLIESLRNYQISIPTSLLVLHLHHVHMESLYIELPCLRRLSLMDNGLKQLDTSWFPRLIYLKTHNNSLRSIDLRGSCGLRHVEICHNLVLISDFEIAGPAELFVTYNCEFSIFKRRYFERLEGHVLAYASDVANKQVQRMLPLTETLNALDSLRGSFTREQVLELAALEARLHSARQRMLRLLN